MPREVVRNADDSALHVGWGYESHVQLGVELQPGFTVEDEDGFIEEFESIWFTLESGKDVDKLIKVLKKARRQAFPND